MRDRGSPRPGPDTYYVKVKDGCNSWSEYYSVSYNIYENIAATAESDAENYCIGATATLTATVTTTNNNGVATYQWYNADV